MAKGADGLNVLPQEAYVTGNLRFIPHQPTDESIELISEKAKQYDLETEVIYKDYPCPVVNYAEDAFRKVEETIHEIYPGIGVSPYVMTGGTDAKYYKDICDNCIRFAPLYINKQQYESIHGLNENISDDPESREFYCEVIMDEASKMNKLVKNLLTLNQLESGKDAPVMERFDIVSLIRGVLGSMHIMIEQKEATVIFEETEPVYVWADEFKIEEVVTNYTSNALNHLDGERKVEIKVLQEEDCVKVTVFNTGTPIPEEDIPNLWNKFYKVDKARTREYGGSGIGLSIVKAIIESMNQKYGVCNYDNGVEFWFTLDCRQ